GAHAFDERLYDLGRARIGGGRRATTQSGGRREPHGEQDGTRAHEFAYRACTTAATPNWMPTIWPNPRPVGRVLRHGFRDLSALGWAPPEVANGHLAARSATRH